MGDASNILCSVFVHLGETEAYAGAQERCTIVVSTIQL